MEALRLDPDGLVSFSDLFPGVRIAMRGEDAARRVWTRTIGSGRATTVDNVADRVDRAAVRADETSRFIKLLLQVEGEAIVVSGGRPVRLEAGDLTLLDGARPFAIEFGKDYKQVFFELPRDLVGRRYERVFALVGRRLPGADGANAMVFDTLSAMAGHLVALSEESRRRTLDVIMGLLGAIVPPEGETSVSRSRLARALADLESHLADPGLGAESLASLQSISRRRLDAVFREHGLSVERLIWSRRLERVAEELEEPKSRDRRLIDIALSWGFSSEAHFSRAFRRKFDETPSAYRRRQPRGK